MMAMSVNRRIERTLPHVMGRRDPGAMIRVRSTDPIRASGLVPRSKAGHMTANDLTGQNAKKTLASRGPSTHDVREHDTPPVMAALGAAIHVSRAAREDVD